MNIPLLETDRLILRGFRAADASDVQALAGKFEIADTTLTIPHPYEDGMAEKWISLHEKAFAESRSVTFAIMFKSDNALVGAISLMGLETGHQAELGYWIGAPYWGRGVCTEAGKSAVAYAFSGLGLVRLHARHLSRNPSSGRVLQKIGFEHEGCRRRHVSKWGKFEDIEEWGLLRDSRSYRPGYHSNLDRCSPGEPAMNLSAARVFVRNLAEAQGFYRAVLGLPLQAGGVEHGFCVFAAGAEQLIIEPIGPDAPDEDQVLVGRFTGLSFAVPSVVDAYNQLQALGVQFTGKPETQSWGGVLATFRDPAGNELQLVQYGEV